MQAQDSARCAFVDMNAFFASVEQQVDEKLRGIPMAVVPVQSDTTCVIAASYEARAFGIKTGTPIREALRLYPRIKLVDARPKLYMEFNQRLLECLNEFFVDIKPLSIDEMACRVGGLDRGRDAELRLGERIKSSIYARLGGQMRCSVGIAPNILLAKVASDMQKPDGLTRLDHDDLPEAVYRVALADLPGIGRSMHGRLRRCGITTVRHLYEAGPDLLRRAWGSVEGPRWYYMLRGSRETDYRIWQSDEQRKSISHSHVLPPEYRTRRGAQDILLRLFTRCMRRLRQYGQAAASTGLFVKLRHRETLVRSAWKLDSRRHLHANDETTWIKIVRPMIEALPELDPGVAPYMVGITFSDLSDAKDLTLNLFDDTFARAEVSRTMDRLNRKRENSLQIASVLSVQHAAPFRIAFGRQFHAEEMAQAAVEQEHRRPAAPGTGAYGRNT
jgi:DNA polymerase IV